MKGKIFLGLFISLIITASIWAVWNQSFFLKGTFFLQNWWSGAGGSSFTGGWYPGKVDFNSATGEILSDGTLSGTFWLGNVGWVSFSHGIWGSDARITCPSNIWNDATQPCPVTGSAWSKNAGWIILGSADIASGSGVYYNPNTGNIEGWWWSRALGWVPIWSGLSWVTVPTISTTTDPLAGVPINFVSSIAIVGNIAGSRVYSVSNNAQVNQDVGYSYRTINHADILNFLRKNIALMSRNISDAELSNVSSVHDFLIYKNQDYRIEYGGWNVPSGKKSIIVMGGDIIINQSDVNSLLWANTPIALIALKDSSGNWGNIIVWKDAKRIYAYLYAEGTIFSWEKANTSAPIVPYTDAWVWNIPQWQLYIRWLVASKNTIWGSQQKPTPICPILSPNCTSANVYAYDWDYFRTYNSTNLTQAALPSERSSIARIQSSTMIIEYDARILTDPPPGFREMK